MSVPNTRDSGPSSSIDDPPSVLKRDVDPLSANSHRRLPWCTMQNPSGRRSAGARHVAVGDLKKGKDRILSAESPTLIIRLAHLT